MSSLDVDRTSVAKHGLNFFLQLRIFYILLGTRITKKGKWIERWSVKLNLQKEIFGEELRSKKYYSRIDKLKRKPYWFCVEELECTYNWRSSIWLVKFRVMNNNNQ